MLRMGSAASLEYRAPDSKPTKHVKAVMRETPSPGASHWPGAKDATGNAPQPLAMMTLTSNTTRTADSTTMMTPSSLAETSIDRRFNMPVIKIDTAAQIVQLTLQPTARNTCASK